MFIDDFPLCRTAKHKLAVAGAFAVFLTACSLTQGVDEIPPVEPPAVVVATLNQLYASNDRDCHELRSGKERGLYYCSGLVIRGVEDGNFLPWTFAPHHIAQGGVSFSWIRHDVPYIWDLPPSVGPFHVSGFIMRNPVYAYRHGLPSLNEGFACIFPMDAVTGSNTNHRGCGFRQPVEDEFVQPDVGGLNARNGWGQCEAVGINNFEQWVDHFESFPINERARRQCSWNVDSWSGWLNAVKAFQRYSLGGQDPNGYYYRHNELILAVSDDGRWMKPNLAAFFYSELPDGEIRGLADAQVFQKKLYDEGFNVPVVRLFRGMRQQVFSYHVEDQVVPQP